MSQLKVINLTAECHKMLREAEAYGEEMREQYQDDGEYHTSKSEVLQAVIERFAQRNYDDVDRIIIPRDFKETVESCRCDCRYTQSDQCGCDRGEFKRFMAKFPQIQFLFM